LSYLNSPRIRPPRGMTICVWTHLGLIKWKTTSKKMKKMEDDLSKKMEDDLKKNQNRRRPQKNNGKQPKKEEETN
jgi:hypothetical protein